MPGSVILVNLDPTDRLSSIDYMPRTAASRFWLGWEIAVTTNRHRQGAPDLPDQTRDVFRTADWMPHDQHLCDSPAALMMERRPI